MSVTARIVITIAVLVCTLAGCASQSTPGRTTNTSNSGNPSAPAESIIVPRQNSPLTQALRRALAERGWHLIGYSKDMTSGDADYQAMAQRAKYRLTLLGTPIGRCQNKDPSFLYRIAIIENQSGDVPVALSGADCLTPIVDEFATDLDQKQMSAIPSRTTSSNASNRQ